MAAKKRASKKMALTLAKEKETKRFVRFAVEDPDGELPFSTIYVRKDSVDGADRVKVTVEPA
jgi:hypothetical protein